jgi:hypothetical protein
MKIHLNFFILLNTIDFFKLGNNFFYITIILNIHSSKVVVSERNIGNQNVMKSR